MTSLNENKTALVTGASVGIGFELAKLFAKNGYSLVLVARREDKMRQLADQLKKDHGTNSLVLPMDLTEESAPEKILAQVKNAGLAVDVLVNNAGFGLFGSYSETDGKTEREMLQVNIVALTQLTKLFLPDMLAKKNGKILNVGSVAGFLPGPLMTVYYATKAYVLSYSEALAKELAGTGVSITVLCPGPVTTEFQDRANLRASRMFSKMVPVSAESTALAGYKALMRNQPVVVPGITNKLATLGPRLLPRELVVELVYMIQERKNGGA